MKKIILTITSFSLAFLMCFTTANASGSDANGDNVEQQWVTIEERINASMEIKSGEYQYNQEEITAIIHELDIESFNEFYGTNYTLDSLTISILQNIDSAKNLNTSKTNARTCNYSSYDSSPWNYVRTWSTHNETITWAADMSYYGDAIDNAGMLISKVPLPKHWNIAINLGFIIASWYFNEFSRALLVNNYSCGTVADINKFTTQFTIDPQ